MGSTAISLLQLGYLIHNDLDALRIEIVETLSGAAAQNAYEDFTTARRVSHQRRLILETTYVDEADGTGCAVLHGSRRLKAADRGVAGIPHYRGAAHRSSACSCQKVGIRRTRGPCIGIRFAKSR